MDVIEISGARYVRASDAAKSVGYTSDYVGQLSRAGKIDARRIGRVWYVKEDDIVAHKRGNARSNKQKTKEEFQRTRDIETGQIHHVLYTPHHSIPEHHKRILDTAVKYERDESPLIPRSSGRHEYDASHHIVVSSPPEEVTEERALEVSVGDDSKNGSRSGPKDEEMEFSQERIEAPMRGRIAVEDVAEEEDSDDEAFDPQGESGGEESSFESRLRKVQSIPRRQRGRSESGEVGSRRFEREPDSRVGLSREIEVVPVPRKSQIALGRPFVTALVPLAVLIVIAFSVATLFGEKVLVYSRGTGILEKPVYETSYGVSAMSSVIESLRISP